MSTQSESLNKAHTFPNTNPLNLSPKAKVLCTCTYTCGHTYTLTRRTHSIPAWRHNKKHLILSHSEPDSHTPTHTQTHSSFFPQELFHHQCPLTWLLGQTGSPIHHIVYNHTWSIHYTHKQLPSFTHRLSASSSLPPPSAPPSAPSTRPPSFTNESPSGLQVSLSLRRW